MVRDARSVVLVDGPFGTAGDPEFAPVQEDRMQAVVIVAHAAAQPIRLRRTIHLSCPKGMLARFSDG